MEIYGMYFCILGSQGVFAILERVTKTRRQLQMLHHRQALEKISKGLETHS